METSVRDLLVPMLTINDNVATDALLDLVGLDTVNALTARLGMHDTHIVDLIGAMLDALAVECGFADYAHLARHNPSLDGPPTEETSARASPRPRLSTPTRGTRTTPADTVRLLIGLQGNATAGRPVDPAQIDTAIGHLARALVDRLEEP